MVRCRIEYRNPGPNVLARVAQLDFIKSRSASVLSTPTLPRHPRRANFREEVLARNAMHILSCRLGDEV